MKLVWLRNDLRLHDNHALFHASRESSGSGVVAVVAITPVQWLKQDEASSRVQFWLANLHQLKQQLARLNIPLRIVRVPTNDELPAAMLALARQLGVTALYFNHEYPEWEQQRDRAVAALFDRDGIRVAGYHSDLVLPPGRVLNKQGNPFRVFTPFSRTWRQVFMEDYPQPLPAPAPQPPCTVASDTLPEHLDYAGASGSRWRAELWPAGSDEAQHRLAEFVTARVDDYPLQRDFPAQDATSSLSPYLSVGALSARQCLACLQAQSGNIGWLDNQWVSELIWREFYRHLLVAFPQMNRWQPFKPEVEARAQWQQDDRLFEAWCRGETGFPLVDAGMKQLLETGWMHNRLRMVTASFLAKLLRQDWRKGARFFMQHLIDGDFASNLGGWQWCASVGADAAPYVRIFSPMRQAERFDAQGEYVAHWLPELASLQGIARHDPLSAMGVGRPAPVIDYALERRRSIEQYNG